MYEPPPPPPFYVMRGFLIYLNNPAETQLAAVEWQQLEELLRLNQAAEYTPINLDEEGKQGPRMQLVYNDDIMTREAPILIKTDEGEAPFITHFLNLAPLPLGDERNSAVINWLSTAGLSPA